MKDFAKQILNDVEEGKEFLLHYSGQRKYIHNIIDLRVELEEMSEEEFIHHVTAEKNDFAKWVEVEIKDEKLAHDLYSVQTREEMILLVRSRINFAVSVLEKDNQKILEDEEKKLQELNKTTQAKEPTKSIQGLLKDVKKMAENIKLENKVIEAEDDLAILPWNKIQKVPANARIMEFIFGMIIGIMLGLLIAKAFFGM